MISFLKIQLSYIYLIKESVTDPPKKMPNEKPEDEKNAPVYDVWWNFCNDPNVLLPSYNKKWKRKFIISGFVKADLIVLRSYVLYHIVSYVLYATLSYRFGQSELFQRFVEESRHSIIVQIEEADGLTAIK